MNRSGLTGGLPGRPVEVLERFVAALGTRPELVVGYSGGPDSHALLLAAGQLRERGLCSVRAVHVNHGWHDEADAWAAQCAANGRRWRIEVEVVKVDAAPVHGQSPEEAAREARYRALFASLRTGEHLCTAHTCEDQGETVLLQLLRGAGPAGLAAMPAHGSQRHGRIHRPWLECMKAELLDLLAAHGETGIADPANVDPRFDRSFLRQRALPLLRERWPGLDRTLSRAARLQAQANQILEEVADEDLATLAAAPGGHLEVTAFLALEARSAPRAHNALRRWLAREGNLTPSERQLEAIISAFFHSRTDAAPAFELAGMTVRRYRGAVEVTSSGWADRAARADWEVPWRPPATLHTPAGTLAVHPVDGTGLCQHRLAGQQLTVCPRRGGERILLGGGGGRAQHRTLKNLLREAAIPPWQRSQLPVVWLGDEVLAVGNRWTSWAYRAMPGEAGWELEWRPVKSAVHRGQGG